MKFFLPLRLKLTLYTLFLITISSISMVLADHNADTTELTIHLLITILLTLFISLYILNRIINLPIEKILKKIDAITNGDYSQTYTIDANDEFSVISNKFNDMAKEISKREKDLDNMVHQDILTKIPNRTMFKEKLEYAISRARRQNTKIAVFFIDIDDFKNINDTLGHDIGDKLLIQISSNLVQAMRKNDLLARIGGDEFNVLIEDLNSVLDAEDIAKKIINHISIPIKIEDNIINITGSVGISIYPLDAKNSPSLLKNADLAMYDAKNDGKNSYKFFSEELGSSLKKRSTMLTELKAALENNEFELYYQPKFSFKTGTIYGAEALIRWNNKKLGFLSPDTFIPLSEETAEIVKIGKWIIKTACKDFARWKILGLDIKQVSINVSNIQFEKDDIVKVLKTSIDEYNLNPGDIEVEITESYVHKNSDNALKILHNIRALGVDLAMDDFGTGYSSMSYLKRLPLTRLKIDKSFIDNIPFDNNDVEITKVIIALAKIMDLSITAEGIETVEQMNFLKDLDCDEGQGYICSEPLPFNQFVSLLESKPSCTNFL